MIVPVSWQSPGQYYFKPMMKEFRFEPSSQMIEVQEGQNLRITITGFRTAYRYVPLPGCRWASLGSDLDLPPRLHID